MGRRPRRIDRRRGGWTDVSDQIVIGKSAQEYFRELVSDALAHRRLQILEATEFYLVNLLAQYLERERLFALPRSSWADYNQALMDLGATICTPRLPDCRRCPVADGCRARLLGLQEQRPVLDEKHRQPHFTVTAAVIHQQGRVLIAQRPAHGLLGGMWEFPGGKLQPGEDLASCLKREILEELGVPVSVGGWLGVYRHAYTHFRVTLHAFRCTLLNGSQPQPVQVSDLRWVEPGELADFPMGKIDRQIARSLEKRR